MTYTPTVWTDGDCVMAADMNNIENGVDRAQGDVMILRGLTAAIPASDPLLVGRLYFESDLLFRVWRDNGAGWDQVHAVAGGAGGAWRLIQEQILGAPAVGVTFAAIPGTYRALALFSQVRTDVAAESDNLNWRANADSGNNYDWQLLYALGAGTAAAVSRAAAFGRASRTEGANSTANNYAICMTLWIGYALPDRWKKCVGGPSSTYGNASADGDLLTVVMGSRWRSTAAITSLLLYPNAGANLTTGCYFALYGIT